jgi:hypothetical protein
MRKLGAFEYRFFPVCTGSFKCLGTPVVSDSSGDRPPEFSKLSYASPPTPTEASAIFTPGPIVEESETFFM